MRALFFIFIAFFASMSLAHAELAAVQLSSAWFADDTKQLTIMQLAAKPVTEFSAIGQTGVSLGLRDDRIWLRVVLQNLSNQNVEGWLDLGTARLAYVLLYQRQGNAWLTSQSGLAVPVQQRAIPHRRVVFPIRLSAHEVNEVYFSIDSSLVNLQPTWWQASDYLQLQSREERKHLLVFGATLAIAGFGLLQAWVSRDSVLAINALRALTAAVWSGIVLGYLGFYWLPEHTAVLEQLIGLILALFLTIQLFLVMRFLPSHLYPKWMQSLFYYAALLALGIGLLTLLFPAYSVLLKLFSVLSSLVQPCVLYACLITAKRGFYPAWWLLAGFCLAVFGFYRKLLETTGLVPPSTDVDFMALVNALISTVLFYLGTTARVDKLQRDVEAQLEQKVKQRTAELEMARDEANQANQAKTLFLAKVSHELRSPLHTILSYADLTLKRQSLHYIKTISAAGQHLLALIDDLLAFVSHSHAELTVLPQSCYTRDLVQQLNAHGKALAARGDNNFVLHISADLPVCLEVDARRLIQIAIILLTNASTYTKKGQIILRLKLSDAKRLQLQITDNGRGIAPEQLPHIFEPFTRATHDFATDGLGLGLAIAQQIATAMGGAVSAHSVLGQGSCFTLDLPLVLGEATPELAIVGSSQVTGYLGATRRIMVVEDNIEHQHLVRELLEAIGFDMIVALTGEELLAKASQHECDLLLMDYLLPDQNANELVVLLRRMPAWEHVPVLLISASVPERTDAFQGVLSKPVAFDTLLAKVAELLAITWTYDTHKRIADSDSGAELTKLQWRHALETGDVFALEAGIDVLAFTNPIVAEQARYALARFDFDALRWLLFNGDDLRG